MSYPLDTSPSQETRRYQNYYGEEEGNSMSMSMATEGHSVSMGQGHQESSPVKSFNYLSPRPASHPIKSNGGGRAGERAGSSEDKHRSIHNSNDNELAGESEDANGNDNEKDGDEDDEEEEEDSYAHLDLPPKPDRAKHDTVKAKYRVLQKKHEDLQADKVKLSSDLELAQNKLDRLQAEADMLVEQMHALYPELSLATTDYIESDDEVSFRPAERARASNGSQEQKDDVQGSRPNAPGSTGRPSTSPIPTAGEGVATAGLAKDAPRPSFSYKPLSPSEAKAQEALIAKEEQDKFREQSKGYNYNPEGIKVRIGVMPKETSSGMSAYAQNTSTPSSSSNNNNNGRTRTGSNSAASASVSPTLAAARIDSQVRGPSTQESPTETAGETFERPAQEGQTTEDVAEEPAKKRARTVSKSVSSAGA